MISPWIKNLFLLVCTTALCISVINIRHKVRTLQTNLESARKDEQMLENDHSLSQVKLVTVGKNDLVSERARDLNMQFVNPSFTYYLTSNNAQAQQVNIKKQPSTPQQIKKTKKQQPAKH